MKDGYKNYGTMIHLCDYKYNTPADTDNTKFLPMNDSIYYRDAFYQPLLLSRFPAQPEIIYGKGKINPQYPQSYRWYATGRAVEPFRNNRGVSEYYSKPRSKESYTANACPAFRGPGRAPPEEVRENYINNGSYYGNDYVSATNIDGCPLSNPYNRKANKDLIAKVEGATNLHYNPIPPDTCNKSCTGGVCKNKNLDPVLDPRYNMREVVKQLILLEDHLSHEGKRCDDCIRKHMLFIEGLIDEAITLDKEQQYIGLVRATSKAFKEVQKEYNSKVKDVDPSNDKFYCMISQKLRTIRKPIMNDQEICTFGCA